MRLNKIFFFYVFIIFISFGFIFPDKARGDGLNILGSVINAFEKREEDYYRLDKPKYSEKKQKNENIDDELEDSSSDNNDRINDIDKEVEEILNKPKVSFEQTKNILNLLPQEVDLLIKIDYQKFLSQSNSKLLLKELLKKKPYLLSDYKEIKEKSGFDLFSDINKIYLFAAYKIDQVEGILNGIVVEGRFDKSKFLKFAKESSYLTRDHYFDIIDGFDALCPKYGKEGYAILLDNKYLIMGSKLGIKSLKDRILGRSFGFNDCLSRIIDIQSKDINDKAFMTAVGDCTQARKNNNLLNQNIFCLLSIDYFYIDFGYHYYEDYGFKAIESNCHIKIDNNKEAKQVDSLLESYRFNFKENFVKKELPHETYRAMYFSEYGGFRNNSYPYYKDNKLDYSLLYTFAELEEIYNGFKIRERQVREKGY